MKPHIPMRSGTLYRKFTDSALQASQGFASIQEWNLGHFTRNSRPQRCKLPKFLLLFRQKYEGAELPLLPPRLRRTLRSAPTKGGEQFAVQTFEPAKWAMTMFRNLIARWHFYVSIEKFQFTFPPLANTTWIQTSKQKSQKRENQLTNICFAFNIVSQFSVFGSHHIDHRALHAYLFFASQL